MLKFSSDAKVVNTNITGLIKRAGVVQSDIDICARGSVVVAHRDRNIDPILRLVAGLGTKETAFRTNALRDWFVFYAPVMIVEVDGKKEFAFDAKRCNLKAAELSELVTDMAGKPFYKWKKQADWSGFDFAAELKKLVDRADNAIKKHGGDDKLKVDNVQFKKVAALV